MLDFTYGMTHCYSERGGGGADQIIRSVPKAEQGEILDKYHASPYEGHFVGDRTYHKILQSGFYWPTLFRDCSEWVKHCDRC